MSGTDKAMNVYLTGLRNQHAVERQAVETIKSEIGRMEPYPALHAQMQQEMQRSLEQGNRLEKLLAQHDSSASGIKAAVTSTIGRISGLIHAPSDDDVVKNVLAAIGFKAYEIGSYKMLVTLAHAAGAASDVAVLEQSSREEMEMGDWLGQHLPEIVTAHLAQS